MIGAILRAQLLSLRTAGRKRPLANALSFIPILLYYSLWTMWALIMGSVLHSLEEAKHTELILSGALAGVFLYWQLAPIITSSMGASLDLQKLIVYPIDRDKLFLVEVALRLFTVGEMLIMLAGIGTGMASNPSLGGPAVAIRLMVALPLFVVFNLLIGAGIRSLIERVFRQKRMRTIGMVVFVLIAVTPSLLLSMDVKWEGLRNLLPLGQYWPWGATARFGIAPTIVPVVFLGVWIAVAYSFGRWQFYRSLNWDPYAGNVPLPLERPGRNRRVEALFRWPSTIWSDPIGALIEKELRSLFRSVGFRVAFIMGFTFGLVVFLPQVLRSGDKPGFVANHFFAWVSVYSLLLIGFYVFWNIFGMDRSAVQFYYAAPVSWRHVFLAKNIAAVIVQVLEVMLIAVVVALLPVPMHWLQLVEGFAVTAVACLFLFALGNLNSVRFPSPVDPDKAGRGASRSKAALTMLLLPLGLLPLVLAYWGRHVFRSEAVFFLLVGLAAAIGAVVYWVALDSAVEMAYERREAIINDLSTGEGPVSSH